MNKNLVRQFNFWRILGIVALVCTILLTVILCAESLKPGEESSVSSGAVTDFIKDNTDINDNEQNVELVSIRCKQANYSHAIGDTMQLSFVYNPSKATNTELTFSSSDSTIVSVDDNGVATYNSFGNAYITATSKANPNVTTTFRLFCSGLHVNDLTNVYPSFADGHNAEEIYTVEAGTCSAMFFKNTDGEYVSINDLALTSSDTSVFYINDVMSFLAVKEGKSIITVENKNSGMSKEITINVKESSFVAPEEFDFYNDIVYVNKQDTFIPRKNISAVLPDGAKFDNRFCKITCDNPSIFDINIDDYTAVGIGEATFTVIPYGTNTKSSFKVVVLEPAPDYLTIIGNDRIVRDVKYTYTAFDGERECDNISWSIVKGDATITDDGKLVANELGKVVIRATSTLDGTIYAELTVRVSLFESFGTFVRKVFGHFSAFAVLGFGFAVTYFLLLGKLRKYSPLFALASGVMVASITEILQLPIFTANRGPSVRDVLLDSTGVLCGIVIAVVLICLLLLLIKLISPHKYNSTKICIGKLSFKTAFLSAKVIKALFDDVDASTTTTIANPTTDQQTITDDSTITIIEPLD